jgi:ABC-2 type transport system ATP-binding protein
LIMEYAIETIALTKIFSDWWGRAKVYAVDDLNLRIHYNEVFGLLGPNGSGKTTTLKMLLGLLYPTKGKAIVLGGEGSDPKINTRIGFLPEESYLYRYLNARETLDFYGRLFDIPAKVRKMRIEALLDMVGLKAVANRPVGTYSKGMARRIGLAQALINDPDLLILDEPTTGLDPIGTRQIKDLILKLAQRGKTILLSSHLLADVEDVCDKIAILYGGKIQAQGRVKDLLQQTNKWQIVTDAMSDDAIEKIRQIAQSENASCEVTSPQDKLENFFIRTVTEAQKEAKTTSGAVSTTQIGGFLAPEVEKESVLDKLVSTPISQQEPSDSQKTDRVVPPQEKRLQPDEQLLSNLIEPDTHPDVHVTDKQAAKSQVESEPNKQDQIDKSILDQLTDGSSSSNKTNDQTEESSEEGD